MKRKFYFILPRLLVLALLAGLASLVLFFVFKLLIAAVVIGAIAAVIVKIVSAVKAHQLNNGAYGQFPGFYPPQQSTALQPVTVEGTQKNPAIIPIN